MGHNLIGVHLAQLKWLFAFGAFSIACTPYEDPFILRKSTFRVLYWERSGIEYSQLSSLTPDESMSLDSRPVVGEG